jgi:transcriptional regulator with XRE-family HTH domain
VENIIKMSRIKTITPILTPEAKRLVIVFNEFGGSQTSFAALLGISQSSLSRMMDSRQPITNQVIKIICFKLGYSPEWFINGTGNKKASKDDVKLITEVSMLRVEMEIMLQKNILMDARMKAYENELDELKKTLQNRV